MKVRVLHVVTGGFSGATQVAVDLARGSLRSGRNEAFLALRRKRHTPPERVAALAAEGLRVELVPGWSHLATIASLVGLCRRLQPDVVVGHGFPEHLLARHAALLAGVPHRVHVEHNSRERYTRWRLAQARWLASRTDRIVGCSEGVRQSLLALGMPPARTIAIPNGIRLEPFADAHAHPWLERTAGIVMSARFSAQKDHLTLIDALDLLRRRGWQPPLLLAGGGSDRHRRRAVQRCSALGLQDQVRFLGFEPDMPGLLMRHRIAVLSSRYEGMPLALVEAMAAGCAVVGSNVPGIRELLHDGIDGLLVEAGNPGALADALQRLLEGPDEAARLASAGRAAALAQRSLELMTRRYDDLFAELAEGP